MRTAKRSAVLTRIERATRIAIVLGSLSAVLYWQSAAAAQTPAAVGPTEIKIGGDVGTPLTISEADLMAGPRATARVVNSHSNKTETYQGVPLAALLQKAHVPQGGKLQGAWLTGYAVVEAEDNYKAVFSLAELDAGFLDSDVLVADTLDGAPLGAGEGPFKLVVPHDKRPARWVRMMKSITIHYVEPFDYAGSK